MSDLDRGAQADEAPDQDLVPRQDPAVVLGAAVGIGLVLPALWALWADLLLPTLWWRGPAGLGLALSAGLLFWGVMRRRRPAACTARPRHRSRPLVWAHAPLAVLLSLALWTRLTEIRGLEIPFFGDSVHHSMIVRLFQLQGGLPNGWEPLAPLASFSYHFGFHALATVVAAAADLAAPRAVLVTGQLLMVLQALTLYTLAAGLTRRPWAGVGAALAAAGLSPMPAYYLNWGRYTQLAGQAVLPVAVLLAVRAAARTESPRTARGRMFYAAAVLLAAGLFLTHYLVAGFMGLLLAAWVLVARGARLGRTWRLGGITLGALLLATPWLPRLADGLILKSATALSTTRVVDPDVYGVLADAWAMWRPDALARNVGWPLILGAGLALVLALAPQRSRQGAAGGSHPPDPLSPRGLTLLGLVWLALILLATYPRLLGLPITGILKDFTVAIAAYLPLGLMVGGGMAALAERIAPRHRHAERGLALAAVALVAAVTWQGRVARDDTFRLVLPDDLTAMGWIREHTSPQAHFLVSSFSAFGQTVQAGDDAGWWLPLLAAPRGSTLPPITVGLEAGAQPGYREAVNRLADLWQADLDAPATRRALSGAGVTHAFVGVTAKVLDRAQLAASPCWEKLYVADVDAADGRPGAEVYRFMGAGPSAPNARAICSGQEPASGSESQPGSR